MRVLEGTFISEEINVEHNLNTNTGSNFLLFKKEKFGLLTATGNEMLPVEFKVIDIQLMINALIDLKRINLLDTYITINNDEFLFDEELVLTIKNNTLEIKDDELIAFFWNELSRMFI